MKILLIAINSDKNHNVWIERRPTYENRGKERWHIRRQTDGSYTFRSKKHGGLLYASKISKKYSGDKTEYFMAKSEKKLGSEASGVQTKWTIKALPPVKGVIVTFYKIKVIN